MKTMKLLMVLALVIGLAGCGKKPSNPKPSTPSTPKPVVHETDIEFVFVTNDYIKAEFEEWVEADDYVEAIVEIENVSNRNLYILPFGNFMVNHQLTSHIPEGEAIVEPEDSLELVYHYEKGDNNQLDPKEITSMTTQIMVMPDDYTSTTDYLFMGTYDLYPNEEVAAPYVAGEYTASLWDDGYYKLAIVGSNYDGAMGLSGNEAPTLYFYQELRNDDGNTNFLTVEEVKLNGNSILSARQDLMTVGYDISTGTALNNDRNATLNYIYLNELGAGDLEVWLSYYQGSEMVGYIHSWVVIDQFGTATLTSSELVYSIY